jgi:hypothetical protein
MHAASIRILRDVYAKILSTDDVLERVQALRAPSGAREQVPC